MKGIKQIVSRGYTTYALTDGVDVLAECKKLSYIVNDFSVYPQLYWSEVYRGFNGACVVIDKGNPINDTTSLFKLLKQAQINLQIKRATPLITINSIRKLREQNGVNVQQLSSLSGVQAKQIIAIESGLSDCYTSTFNRLITALNNTTFTK